jgi:hypothetical protein
MIPAMNPALDPSLADGDDIINASDKLRVKLRLGTPK